VRFFPPPIPVFIRHFSFRPNLVFPAWSESAASSAPVEDEDIKPILGMNQKHILPYPRFLVFSASFLPQSFSLLATSPSYLPHLILHSLHVFEKKKMTMVAFVNFFDTVATKKGNDNYCHFHSFFSFFFSLFLLV
jgi:hypothetical protein